MLAETWNGSARTARWTWLRMFSAEPRVDLVEHVLAVEERPHLADGLVADAGDDAADVVQHGVDARALGVPVVPRARQLAADGVALAGRRVDVAS